MTNDKLLACISARLKETENRLVGRIDQVETKLDTRCDALENCVEALALCNALASKPTIVRFDAGHGPRPEAAR